MSLYNIIKFSIGIFVLMGAGIMLIGAGKLWMAYDYYNHSKQVPGIFKGYHNEEHLEKFRDSTGYTSYRKVSEYFPMFVYQDDTGKIQQVTSEESHVFRYLSYDDKIDVLLRTDRDETPRLGGFMGLYFSPLVTMAFAGLFIYLPLKALRFADRWLESKPGSAAHAHLQTQMLERANDTIKTGDVFLYLFILFGLFAVMAGALWYFTVTDSKEELPPPPTAEQSTPTPPKPSVATNPKPAASATIKKPVYERQGSTQLYEAARHGDSETVRRLLVTGERIYDIRPAVVQTLIRKNDKATLKLIFADGFDLSQHYARQTFGDQAVAEGRSNIVRLISQYQGVFEAPPVFVALAAEDSAMLKNLIKETDPEIRFRGMTLQRYAQRYRKENLLLTAMD